MDKSTTGREVEVQTDPDPDPEDKAIGLDPDLTEGIANADPGTDAPDLARGQFAGLCN